MISGMRHYNQQNQSIAFDELNDYIKTKSSEYKHLITSSMNQDIIIIVGLHDKTNNQFVDILREPRSTEQNLQTMNEDLVIANEAEHDQNNDYSIFLPEFFQHSNLSHIYQFKGLNEKQELKDTLLNAYLQKKILESASSVSTFFVVEESSFAFQRGKELIKLIESFSDYANCDSIIHNCSLIVLNAQKSEQEFQNILERDWKYQPIVEECLKHQKIYQISRLQKTIGITDNSQKERLIQRVSKECGNPFKQVEDEALFSLELKESLKDLLTKKQNNILYQQLHLLQSQCLLYKFATNNKKEFAQKIGNLIRNNCISNIIEPSLKHCVQIQEKNISIFYRQQEQKQQQVENQKQIDLMVSQQSLLKWIFLIAFIKTTCQHTKQSWLCPQQKHH